VKKDKHDGIEEKRGEWDNHTYRWLLLMSVNLLDNQTVVAQRVSEHDLTPAVKVAMQGYLRKTSQSIHTCQNTFRYCLHHSNIIISQN
jgi:hypothetical protein